MKQTAPAIKEFYRVILKLLSGFPFRNLLEYKDVYSVPEERSPLANFFYPEDGGDTFLRNVS
jgi:hypothetical protein